MPKNQRQSEHQQIPQETFDTLVNTIKGLGQGLVKKNLKRGVNDKVLPAKFVIGGVEALINLDSQKGTATVEIPVVGVKPKVQGVISGSASKQHHEICTHHESESVAENPQKEKLIELQARIDDLLSGKAETKKALETDRPFAPFLSSDQKRASALEALCEQIADRTGGLEGLECAINKLYEKVEKYPPGLVQQATKLFLTHYKPARDFLQIRSLEERQPGMVFSSQYAGPIPS